MDKTLQITLPDLQELQAYAIIVRNKTRGQRPSVACEEIERRRLRLLKDHCRALFTPEAQARRRAREATWINLERLSPAEITAYKWLQDRGPDPQVKELELHDEDVQIIIWRLQGHSYGQIGRWLNKSHQWVTARVQWLKPHHLPPFIKIRWIKGGKGKASPLKSETKRRPLKAQLYWAWVIAWQQIHRDPQSALTWLQEQADLESERGLWTPNR